MGALLEQRMGLIPLSSGVIFRMEIEAETDLGRLAMRYIHHGELVPNGVTIEMMSKRLREPRVRHHGFVLDGFPRTIKQAEALDELLNEESLHLDEVVCLDAPEDLIVHRLTGRLGCTKCGEIYHSVNKPPMREGLCDKCNSNLFVRSDDQPQAIRERLRVFREQTAPLIEYYGEHDLLRRVDASQGPEETYHGIENGLPEARGNL